MKLRLTIELDDQDATQVFQALGQQIAEAVREGLLPFADRQAVLGRAATQTRLLTSAEAAERLGLVSPNGRPKIWAVADLVNQGSLPALRLEGGRGHFLIPEGALAMLALTQPTVKHPDRERGGMAADTPGPVRELFDHGRQRA